MDYAPVRWSALLSPATLLVLILFAALLIGIGFCVVARLEAWRAEVDPSPSPASVRRRALRALRGRRACSPSI
jgi:hypothetical protein